MSRSTDGRWCLGLSLGDGLWAVALRDRQSDRVGLLGQVQASGATFVQPWSSLDGQSPESGGSRLLLDAGLPYRNPQTGQAHPLVTWAGELRPLPQLLEMLAESLARLRDPAIAWVTATGKPVPSQVLRSVEDVVVGYPVPSGEAFRFNSRELVLKAGLVTHGQRVMTVAEGLGAALGWDGLQGWGCCWVIDLALPGPLPLPPSPTPAPLTQAHLTQITLLDRDFGRQLGQTHGLTGPWHGWPQWIETLNSALNHLVAQSGIAPQKVERILLRGAIAQAPRSSDPTGALQDYLRQKCPSATLHWEPSSQPLGRLAMGLSRMVDCPPWDEAKPYDDYFLFAALLRHLTPEPQPLDRLLEALAQDGIHGRTCRRSIQQLLAGEIPPGLLPHPCWAPNSLADPDYQALAAQSPFQCLASGWYALDASAGTRWRRYLGLVWGRSSTAALEPIGAI